jgi:hypothetical protein
MTIDVQAEATPTGEPFDTLSALRAAHGELMRESRNQVQPRELVPGIRAFLLRAIATGTRLGAESEREAAQNILDYWAASLLATPGVDPRESLSFQLAPFDRSMAPDLSGKPNPYAGLDAFGEASADRFFGRDEALRILAGKVERHAVVFVIGPLGGGKTSLVAAGLLPWMLRFGQVKRCELPIVTPGMDPLASMLRAIHQLGQAKLPELGQWSAQQKTILRRRPAAIRDIVANVTDRAPAILVVDQFEEVFTLCREQEDRELFVRALAALAQDDRLKHKIILIVRDDMAGQVFQLRELQPFSAEADARFSPPSPTPGELLRMIELPAERVGLKFDDGIVEDIAKEVTGELTALPLLQFTLSQLWAARDRDRVTWDVYRKVGRPREALRRTVTRVCESLSAEDLAATRRMFLELVEPSGGSMPALRRLRRERLMRLPESDRVKRLLDLFVEAGLIRMTPGVSLEDDRFEVANEALVNSWPLLQEWLREEQHTSEEKIQFVAGAQLWQRSNYDPGYLLSGEALKTAIKYRDAAPELAELIATSEASVLRNQRTDWLVRGFAAISAIFIVIIFALLILQSMQERSREDEKKIIDAQNHKQLTDVQKGAEEREQVLLRRIDELQNQLSAKGMSIPGDASTETVPPQVAQSAQEDRSRDAGSMPIKPLEGYVWIGPENPSNLSDIATSVTVPVSALQVGQQYKVNKNLVFREGKPSTDYVQTASIGVIPEQSIVTILESPLKYIRSTGAQYWARVRGEPPQVVYVQYWTSSSDAQRFADILARKYRIPGVQKTEVAKNLNEIRYYYPKDERAANRLVEDVKEVLRDLGYQLPPPTVSNLTSKQGPQNYPGVIELWLDLPDRSAPPKQ